MPSSKPALLDAIHSAPSWVRTLPRRARWSYLERAHRLPSISLDELTAVPRAAVAAPIEDDVCMPPFLGTSECDDLGAILRIAQGRQPSLICEIGTAFGNLSANLLRACPAARLITINAPKDLQSGVNVTYELDEAEIGRVYRRYGYADRVEQVFCNSLDLDLGQYTARSTVGLAIVDGCHDTPFVVNDFLKVHDFIEPGGLVLLHDTHPSQEGHLIGSYRGCLLLRRQGFDIRWLEGTWWGVWVRPTR